MQERIRFVEELHPGRSVYNAPSAHRLAGPLDRVPFEAALQAMIRRQPALRTPIARSAQGTVQRVLRRCGSQPAFRGPPGRARRPAGGRTDAADQAIVDRPIPLDEAPLFRVALYRTAPEEHVFLFMAHHLVWDGWSFDLLYEEISAAYGAALSRPAQPPCGTAGDDRDFADWHDQMGQVGRVPSADRVLEGAVLEGRHARPLPTDHPARPA